VLHTGAIVVVVVVELVVVVVEDTLQVLAICISETCGSADNNCIPQKSKDGGIAKIPVPTIAL
jgi:hypothetical protein